MEEPNLEPFPEDLEGEFDFRSDRVRILDHSPSPALRAPSPLWGEGELIWPFFCTSPLGDFQISRTISLIGADPWTGCGDLFGLGDSLGKQDLGFHPTALEFGFAGLLFFSPLFPPPFLIISPFFLWVRMVADWRLFFSGTPTTACSLG